MNATVTPITPAVRADRALARITAITGCKVVAQMIVSLLEQTHIPLIGAWTSIRSALGVTPEEASELLRELGYLPSAMKRCARPACSKPAQDGYCGTRCCDLDALRRRMVAVGALRHVRGEHGGQ